MKEHIEHCFDGLKDMFSGTESYDSRYLVGALYADSSIPFNALNGSEGFLDGAAQWLGKAWDYIKYQSEFILTEFIPNFLSVLDYSFEYLGSSNFIKSYLLSCKSAHRSRPRCLVPSIVCWIATNCDELAPPTDCPCS